MIRGRAIYDRAAAGAGRGWQHRHVPRFGQLLVCPGERGYGRQAGVQRSMYEKEKQGGQSYG